MLKKASGGVSRRSEAQRTAESTIRASLLAAALPEGLFEHPVSFSDSISDHARLCVFRVQNSF